MWEYTREKYIISDEAKWWVNRTLNDLWRVHKSRMKKHHTKYATDEERIKHRPDDIPLEDFKQLLKYWGDGEVQKKKNPQQASPSGAQLYMETRERKEGREYMPTTKAVKKKLKRIKRMIGSGTDPEPLLTNGKKRGREWLVGRSRKKDAGTSNISSTDPFVEELTRKIRTSLESEIEVKVNKKVQDNISMVLKRLQEANPGMKIDVGDFCAVLSSEDDENATPLTIGAGYTT